MSTTEDKGNLLSDNHRRGIAAAFLLLDRMLCDIEEYACGREVRSIFCVQQNALSAEQKMNLLAEIAQMRGLLGEIKSSLGLEVQTEDVERNIWGQCVSFAEVLVATKSRFLKRYGPPAPQLAEYLDPRIDVLIEHLQNLTDLTGKGASRK